MHWGSKIVLATTSIPGGLPLGLTLFPVGYSCPYNMGRRGLWVTRTFSDLWLDLSAVQGVLEEPELSKSIRSRNEPVKNNPRNVGICVLDTGDFVVLS
jgi:hypothetical protein